MKVLHVITSLNIGGAERSLLRLLEGLTGGADQHSVVSLIPPGPVGEQITQIGVPVRSLGMRPGVPTPVAFFRLRAILRREKPDIVQTWLYHADLLGLLAARSAGIRRVAWNIRASNMDLARYGLSTRLTVKACSWLSGLPSVVIANSQAGIDWHRSLGYRPKSWELIPNGVDTAVFYPDENARSSVREELGLPEKTLLIGLAARFDPMKGHETFIRAAGTLHTQYRDVHFLLCGTGIIPENRDLEGWIVEEGLQGFVHLLGPRQDMHRINAALDIATLTSHFGEGFPNVVAEAMACGVPCAVADVGDAAAIVGETGRVVPAGDPEAMAQAWTCMLELTEDERREMGAAARFRIETEFSLGRFIQRYEDLYRQMMQS